MGEMFNSFDAEFAFLRSCPLLPQLPSSCFCEISERSIFRSDMVLVFRLLRREFCTYAGLFDSFRYRKKFCVRWCKVCLESL